jgi:hypothetical protein
MSIWGCFSPATYCQPAAAAGFIHRRSQEWALHSPSPTAFVYLEFFWTHAPFVFSSIQPYPPVAIATLWWSFLHNSHCYKLPPLQGCWAGAAAPTLSDWLFYLQFTWRSAPPPLSRAQSSLPSLLCVFFFPAACLLFSFLVYFSPLGGGQSVHGAMLGCLWEYCMALSSPGGLLLPSRVGAGIWQGGSPPGFSI